MGIVAPLLEFRDPFIHLRLWMNPTEGLNYGLYSYKIMFFV